MQKQELTTSKQIVEEEQRCKRMGKGRAMALSRRVYRLLNTDVYYVESESSDNTYYFVKYNLSDSAWCSCRDNSTRGMKCKHIWSIEFAIRFGTLKDTDKLPAEAKVSKITAVSATAEATIPKSYTQDDYSF